MEDFGLRLENSDKNKILKLIGIIDALKDLMPPGTVVIDYTSVEGKQIIKAMTTDEIEEYTEKIWNMIQ